MRKLSERLRQSTDKTQIGKPGASRSDRVTWVGLWRLVTWRRRLTITAIAAVGLAALAFLGTQSLIYAAGAVVVVSVAVGLLTWAAYFPDATKTTFAVLAIAPMLVLMADVQATQLSESFPVIQYTLAPMLVWLALVAVIVHALGFPHMWLQVLVTMLTAAAAGVLLGGIFGPVGLAMAYALSGVVLFALTGGRHRIRLWWWDIQQRVPWSRSREGALNEVTEDASAQERTAGVLAEVPAGMVVLHDVAPRRAPELVCDHVVIGSAGVVLVHSLTVAGVARDVPLRGLRVGNRDLTADMEHVLAVRDGLAGALGLPVDAVRPVLVLHDTVLPRRRQRIGLFDGDAQLGEVVVLAPESLLGEVDVPGLWSAGDIKRIASRARIRLRPARTALAQARPGLRSSHATSIDPDGHTELDLSNLPAPVLDGTRDTGFLVPGAAVAMLTNQGIFAGVRVATEPYVDHTNTWVVGICEDAEWSAALAEERTPDHYPYPVGALRPA